jgi:hypothetical protein
MTMHPDDPWAHRSEGMRCKSCMWFVPKTGPDGITDLGRCRRHAPSATGFVPVFVNDWCGDHRLNENWVAEQSRPVPLRVPIADQFRQAQASSQAAKALNTEAPHANA